MLLHKFSTLCSCITRSSAYKLRRKLLGHWSSPSPLVSPSGMAFRGQLCTVFPLVKTPLPENPVGLSWRVPWRLQSQHTNLLSRFQKGRWRCVGGLATPTLISTTTAIIAETCAHQFSVAAVFHKGPPPRFPPQFK